MHRVSMVPSAFGPEGANSRAKEGASRELRSGQKPEGWPLWGSGSISHLACSGNAGRGGLGGVCGAEWQRAVRIFQTRNYPGAWGAQEKQPG